LGKSATGAGFNGVVTPSGAYPNLEAETSIKKARRGYYNFPA